MCSSNALMIVGFESDYFSKHRVVRRNSCLFDSSERVVHVQYTCVLCLNAH